jgi:tight adherence protein B
VQIVAVFFLASAAIGGVVYVFLYPMLSGERKAEQRMQSVTGTTPTTRATRGPQKSRRDVIESTLKDFDERHKKSKSVPLSARIARAGLSWSKRQFAIISAAIGLAMFALGTFAGAGLLVSAVLAFAGAYYHRSYHSNLSALMSTCVAPT